MEDYAVVSVKELVKLEKKLENVSEYLPKLKLQKIIEWARKDILEIKRLSNFLIENKLFEENNYSTKRIELDISKDKSVITNIFEIYTTLEDELENWRSLYLELKRKSINKYKKGEIKNG